MPNSPHPSSISHHHLHCERDERPPSPPTQTFHPSFLPKPSEFSVFGGAHYSGAKVVHRKSDIRRASFGDGHVIAELSERRKRLIDDLYELYSCRPSLEIIERGWRKDATFEDPFVVAKGADEIAAQWFSLPKIFSESVTVGSHILQSSYRPNCIVISQTQTYTLRVIGVKKTIKSIIIIEVDDDDKIIRLHDQWNGEDLPMRWGAFYVRRLTGRALPWIFKPPKELRYTE